MINSDIAYRLRYHRGLALSPKGEYSNPRLKEIAEEMSFLFKKLKGFDEEIVEMRIKEFGPIKESEK